MDELQQPQLCVMNQLKEQLEERTRILQADIKTQQQELHDIKEKLQLANLQVTVPKNYPRQIKIAADFNLDLKKKTQAYIYV